MRHKVHHNWEKDG